MVKLNTKSEFNVFCRAGAGHSKYLGEIKAYSIEEAFEIMKRHYIFEWNNSQRYVECYIYGKDNTFMGRKK
jgi:hypothetical protein